MGAQSRGLSWPFKFGSNRGAGGRPKLGGERRQRAPTWAWQQHSMAPRRSVSLQRRRWRSPQKGGEESVGSEMPRKEYFKKECVNISKIAERSSETSARNVRQGGGRTQSVSMKCSFRGLLCHLCPQLDLLMSRAAEGRANKFPCFWWWFTDCKISQWFCPAPINSFQMHFDKTSPVLVNGHRELGQMHPLPSRSSQSGGGETDADSENHHLEAPAEQLTPIRQQVGGSPGRHTTRGWSRAKYVGQFEQPASPSWTAPEWPGKGTPAQLRKLRTSFKQNSLLYEGWATAKSGH